MIYSALFLLPALAAAATAHKVDYVNLAKADFSSKMGKVMSEVKHQKPISERVAAMLEKDLSAHQMDISHIKFDEDAAPTQLRSLRMRDNFISMTQYTDASCDESKVNVQLGYLVNFCFNEDNETTGEKKSYIYKINKSEKTAVELQYNDWNCMGVPKRLHNLLSDFPAYSEYGECFNQDGDYYKLDYLTTYPAREAMGSNAGYFVAYDHLEQTCTSNNMNYFSYFRFPMTELDKYFKFGTCQDMGGFSMMYQDICSTSRNVMVSMWRNNDCSGPPPSTFPAFASNCKDAKDNEMVQEVDDDDGFDYSHSLQLQFCT